MSQKMMLLKRMNIKNSLKKNAVQTTDISSDFVKKTDYSKKINEIENKITDHDHGKHITTQEFNKLTANTSLQD